MTQLREFRTMGKNMSDCSFIVEEVIMNSQIARHARFSAQQR